MTRLEQNLTPDKMSTTSDLASMMLSGGHKLRLRTACPRAIAEKIKDKGIDLRTSLMRESNLLMFLPKILNTIPNISNSVKRTDHLKERLCRRISKLGGLTISREMTSNSTTGTSKRASQTSTAKEVVVKCSTKVKLHGKHFPKKKMRNKKRYQIY